MKEITMLYVYINEKERKCETVKNEYIAKIFALQNITYDV